MAQRPRHDRALQLWMWLLAMEVGYEIRGLSSAMDRLDDVAARSLGLHRTDLRCLGLLIRRGTMRPSDLAAAMGLSDGGLSIALRRLERAGYIRREGHPGDRRGVVVFATEQAVTDAQRVFGALEKRMGLVVGSLRSEEQELVRHFMVEIRRAIEDQSTDSQEELL